MGYWLVVRCSRLCTPLNIVCAPFIFIMLMKTVCCCCCSCCCGKRWTRRGGQQQPLGRPTEVSNVALRLICLRVGNFQTFRRPLFIHMHSGRPMDACIHIASHRIRKCSCVCMCLVVSWWVRHITRPTCIHWRRFNTIILLVVWLKMQVSMKCFVANEGKLVEYGGWAKRLLLQLTIILNNLQCKRMIECIRNKRYLLRTQEQFSNLLKHCVSVWDFVSVQISVPLNCTDNYVPDYATLWLNVCDDTLYNVIWYEYKLDHRKCVPKNVHEYNIVIEGIRTWININIYICDVVVAWLCMCHIKTLFYYITHLRTVYRDTLYMYKQWWFGFD